MAFIEFHLLQNFAPGNLNRDDNNTPKSCVFGGFRRARISSQCQKRQIRLHPDFEKSVIERHGDMATRTKKLAISVKDFLIEQGKDPDQAELAATKLLSAVSINVVPPSKKKNVLKTNYLLYLGNKEITDIKQVALEHFEQLISEKKVDKEVTKVIKAVFEREAFAADIAMFGRMVADYKEMNVDAACQVAHAISTNVVQNDADFFTAVEDENAEDEQGSGMMGTLFFNSACYYRYAQINLDKLQENLGENADLTVGACLGFLRAMVEAKPTGKQNSFAAQNPASYVRVMVRDAGAPWSLTNAFAKPVDPKLHQDIGLETASANALHNTLSNLKGMYGEQGFVFEGVSTILDTEEPGSEVMPLSQLEDKLASTLAEVFG